MVLMNVSLPIRLPKASGSNPIEFSKRLANLPDELKVMIIRQAVSTPRVIDLRQYEQARFTMTEPFRVDDDYLVIAREEFDRTNRFKTPSSFVFPAELAIRIRHLQICFTLTCIGGSLQPGQPWKFPMSSQDTTALTNILSVFTRLDSLEIALDNTGNAVSGIAYTAYGRTISRSKLPACLAIERLHRVVGWITHVRSISVPQWRQGLEIDKRLSIIHNYTLQGSGRVEVEVVRQTPPSNTDSAKTLGRLYEMLDAPVAVVHYLTENSEHAVRIERKERERRDQELGRDEGAESE